LLMSLFQDVIAAGVRLDLIQIWDTDKFGWGPTWGGWGSDFITEYTV